MVRKRKCPLTPAEWISLLQSWTTQNITIALSKIGSSIAIIVALISLTYLAEINDKIINNLTSQNIGNAVTYIILQLAIMILVVVAGLKCIKIATQLNGDMKMSSDLIDNILDGKLDTNAIKREWDKRKEEMPRIRRKGKEKDEDSKQDQTIWNGHEAYICRDKK